MALSTGYFGWEGTMNPGGTTMIVNVEGMLGIRTRIAGSHLPLTKLDAPRVLCTIHTVVPRRCQRHAVRPTREYERSSGLPLCNCQQFTAGIRSACHRTSSAAIDVRLTREASRFLLGWVEGEWRRHSHHIGQK